MARPPPTGLPANRIEALSDGVFAIAMTILVLNIQVPEGGGAEHLVARLGILWPKFASYGMSFVMLGVLWIGHHFQFHYIRRTDRPLLWINLVFLLAVTFLPFSTAVLANYYEAHVAVILYGSTLVVAGGCLLAHWEYATHRRRLVHAEIEQPVIASVRSRIAGGLVACVVATAIGAIDTRVSLIVFLAMPVAYLLPTRVDKHVASRES
jgi:TMEM175 potassium channel family protein